MTSTTFRSRPLPAALDEALRGAVGRAHAARPLSPVDPREAARRLAPVLGELGIVAVVYRGGVDLQGAEVDHVWLTVRPDDGAEGYVLDPVLPLFHPEFVVVLRAFVAGEATPAQLEAAASGRPVDERVLGVIPPPVRYCGAPVWYGR